MAFSREGRSRLAMIRNQSSVGRRVIGGCGGLAGMDIVFNGMVMWMR